MRTFAALAASLALLGGCATSGGINTSHAALERAETLAENAYVAAVPFMSLPQQQMAWADLQRIRTAYNTGQDITTLVSLLMADLPKAKS